MDPLEELELVMTNDPLPSEEQPTEAPKRRRGRPRKADPESLAGVASSTDGSSKPRRTYTRRTADPCKQVEQLEETIEGTLSGLYLLAGGAVAMVLPVTGMTVSLHAQQGAQAVITAAKSNPALAGVLLKMMKASAWTPLVMWGAGIGVAAMVDVGFLPPQNIIAQNTIGDVLQHFQMQPQQSPNGTVDQNAPSADASVDVPAWQRPQ